ncbi:hypothetical protein FRB99_002094 [Tulasnella sp. 403]|nr:hypothetical protein FRB99_002094 [Tulasnella sp. 403]
MNLTRFIKRTKAQVAKRWPALEKLIRLADAANIPICGGVFGVATQVIDIINVSERRLSAGHALILGQKSVGDSKSACHDLLITLERYSELLDNFTKVMDTSYIRTSNEPPAEIARSSMVRLQGDLAEVLTIVQKQSSHSTFRRFVSSEEIAGEVVRCKERLAASYNMFMVRGLICMSNPVLNVLQANVALVTAGTVQRVHSGGSYDAFKILGAKQLSSDAVAEMEPLEEPSYEIHSGNLTPVPLIKKEKMELVTAEVDGKKRVVRLYRGDEDAFLRHLRWLQQFAGPYFQIYGHCQDSSIPFIVYRSSSLMKLKNYLLRDLVSDPSNLTEFYCRNLQCMVQMRDAFIFLGETDPNLSDPQKKYQTFLSMAQNAKVDERGKVIMPVVETRQFPSLREKETNHEDVVPFSYLRAGFEELEAWRPVYEALIQTDNPLTQVQDTRGVLDLVRKKRISYMERSSRVWLGFAVPGQMKVLVKQDEIPVSSRQLGWETLARVPVETGWRLCNWEQTFESVEEVQRGIFRCTPLEKYPEPRERSNGFWTFESILFLDEEGWHIAATYVRKASKILSIPTECIRICLHTSGFFSMEKLIPKQHENEPVYFFVHLSHSDIRWYWTHSAEPLDKPMADAQKPAMEAKGCSTNVGFYSLDTGVITLFEDEVKDILSRPPNSDGGRFHVVETGVNDDEYGGM